MLEIRLASPILPAEISPIYRSIQWVFTQADTLRILRTPPLRIVMNVLIGYDKFSKREAGGARVSIHTLLDSLSHRRPDIRLDVYQSEISTIAKPAYVSQIETIPLGTIPTFWWIHQLYVRRQWSRSIDERISPGEYDVALTQGIMSPSTVNVCNKKEIPSVIFIRSLRIAGFKHFNERESNRSLRVGTMGDFVQYPFLIRNRSDYTNAIQSADVVVANSEFTQRAIKTLFGTDSVIIYPPITIEDYQTAYNPDGKITMINPRSKAKGADIFLDIAERLDEEQFLLVGPIAPQSHRDRAESLENVEHWEWCEDMRRAYGQSKLVLVPSRASESFGRVPAEAMCSGIPCVVSNRGGLPYVVGDTGEIVSDIESTAAWIEAIQDALESHSPEQQIARVERKFSTEVQVDTLEQILQDVTG